MVTRAQELTGKPSCVMKGVQVVIRFDPLALNVFGAGMAPVSWQQLH